MAGHRRGTDKPRRLDAQPARRKRTIDERLVATRNPRQKISIAFDFLRMHIAKMSDADQKRVARHVVNTLRKLADDVQSGRI